MDEQNKPNEEEKHVAHDHMEEQNKPITKSNESNEYVAPDQDEQMRKAYHMEFNQWADQQEQQEQQSETTQQVTMEEPKTEPPKAEQLNQLKKPKEKKPPKWKGFFQMMAAAVLGSALTLGAVTQVDSFQSSASVPNNHQEQQQAQDQATNAQPVSTTNQVADTIDSASEAIVGIVNMGEQQNPFTEANGEVKKGVGSGVIYKVTKDAAYIVTNNHVIENASSLNISLKNGDTVDGELIGTDPLTDIAVLKIEGDYDITPLKFGDSDALRTGDQVIAIGNPLGLDLSGTVTQGIISATDRTIPVQTSMGEWEFEVIQTDAAINPGNSGGALINSQGELVGINSLKIANSGVEGLGFAIPSNEVKQLVDEISEDGKVVRPYVGVGLKSVSEIPPYYLQNLPENVKDGAVVLSVDEHSSAGKAGIKIEDVIVAINGENVTSDKDFRSYLYKEASIGDKVTLDLYRNGKMEKVELTLTSNADVK